MNEFKNIPDCHFGFSDAYACVRNRRKPSCAEYAGQCGADSAGQDADKRDNICDNWLIGRGNENVCGLAQCPLRAGCDANIGIAYVPPGIDIGIARKNCEVRPLDFGRVWYIFYSNRRRFYLKKEVMLIN